MCIDIVCWSYVNGAYVYFSTLNNLKTNIYIYTKKRKTKNAKICRTHTYIYVALFPPIVEDTHMKIQYSEQNKKEKLYYIRYLNTMCATDK